MEKCVERSCPLSGLRTVLLFLHYFLGYQFIYPMLLKSFTLWLNPSARSVPEWLQFSFYCFMMAVAAWLAMPLLKESTERMKSYGWKLIKLCLLLFAAYYVCSLAVNIIVLLLSESETSANQMEIIEAINVSPYLTMFSTLIYAPIVEELVFRGVFYRALRPHFHWLLSALISAFLFGFIHVMFSLLTGNFNDLIYLLSYGLIGFFLALAYEKSDTIFAGMLLHFFNNAFAFLIVVL